MQAILLLLDASPPPLMICLALSSSSSVGLIVLSFTSTFLLILAIQSDGWRRGEMSDDATSFGSVTLQ